MRHASHAAMSEANAKNKPILSHVTSDTPVTVAIKSEMMGPEQICIAAREAYVTPTASG